MKVSLTTRKRKPNMIRSTPKRWKRKRDQPPPPPSSSPPPPPPPPPLEAEDDIPISPIACLNNVNDIKRFEESEDCFILGFDPFDSNITALNPNPKPLDDSATQNSNANDDDVRVLAEKGQVACRDFPHPRHACVKYPFTTSYHTHKTHCELCFCFICDSPAPCKYWTRLGHCHADSSDSYLRKLHKSGKLHT